MEQPPSPAAPPTSGRGRIARIAGIAVVPALIGAFIGLGGFDLVIPQDPYLEVTEEAGLRMMNLPGFEDRFGELADEDAFEAGAEIGIAAIPRLSDAELEEWLTITREIVNSVDDPTCAIIVRGPDESDDWLAVFRTIDLETYRRYLDLLVGGVEAELADAPLPNAPTQAEVDAALSAMIQQIGPERFDEIGVALANPAAASDGALCAAMGDLYNALAELDSESRSTLIRTLLGVAAST
jgi:hypothetical protein